VLQNVKPVFVQNGSAAVQLLFPLRLTQGCVVDEQLVQVIVVVQQVEAVPQFESVFQEM
jgi:hypothetical protein